MILELLVKVVEETRQGVSQSTGNEWKSKNVVLEAQDGNDVFRIQARMYGQVVDQFEQLGLAVGSIATFDLRFATEMYRGYVSNKISVLSIHNS